jgi:hypothetical protein
MFLHAASPRTHRDYSGTFLPTPAAKTLTCLQSCAASIAEHMGLLLFLFTSDTDCKPAWFQGDRDCND